MRGTRGLLGAAAVVVAALVVAGGASASAGSTCSGGSVAAGNYTSLTISGTCTIDQGSVTVSHDLRVLPGAALLAVFGNSNLTVGHDLRVAGNAIAVLGCEPEEAICLNDPDQTHGTLTSTTRVGHDLRTDGALAVLLHHDWVGHDVGIDRGGGGAGPTGCDGTTLFGGPPFGTVEDTTVGHDLTIANVQTCWFGVIRNDVAHDIRYDRNVTTDPDGNEIVTNTVGHDLSCTGNDPAPQFGDSQGNLNIVHGHARGQCTGLAQH